MRVVSNSGHFHHYHLVQDEMVQHSHPSVVVPTSPDRDQPILRQSASRVLAFSSQYGGEESAFAYTSQNLAGETRIYPRYGDCSHAAVFRTFDRWWADRSLLWLDKEFDYGVDPNELSEDFIQLSYTTAVYLKAVEIYETFNVGHVVRVYAGYVPSIEEPVQKWILLWHGTPDLTLPNAARAFVPPLQLDKLNGLPINAIRLEVCANGAEYYPELDAVYIHGYPVPSAIEKGKLCDPESDYSSGLKFPHLCKRQFSQISVEDDSDLDHNVGHVQSKSSPCSTITSPSKLTDIQDNAWSMWSVQQALLDIQRLSSKLPSSLYQQNLDTLPHELVHEIVSWLPRHDRTRTLIRLSLVCKRLFASLRDPSMHDVMDFKPCWNRVDADCLSVMANLSRDLKHLRLSWLPVNVDAAPFFKALQTSRLHTLILSCCQQVNNELLEAICSSQAHIQTIDLSGCRAVTPDGFACLEKLTEMRNLSLYRTLIAEQILVQLLEQLLKLESLNIGSLSKVSNMDSVLRCISLSCPNMRSLDCWRGKSVTHFGLRDLSLGCPKLEELDLGWCGDVRSSTSIFRHLAKSLPKLRRLLLTANRTVCDADLDFFATYLFDSLEHLDILGCRDITSAGVLTLLDRCRKLRFLDISFCASLDFDEVIQLRKTFPDCAIKKSYQP